MSQSMSVRVVTVSNRLISEYYSPIVLAEYTTGIFSKSLCRREVICEKSTGKWFFVEGRVPCPEKLSVELTAAYNNALEVRRSSRPPAPIESVIPIKIK